MAFSSNQNNMMNGQENVACPNYEDEFKNIKKNAIDEELGVDEKSKQILSQGNIILFYIL
jgi:hypothetical protein